MINIKDDNGLKKTGEHLKKLRKQYKLSGEELAYRSNISHSQITRIESGNQNPTLSTLISICKGLNISLEDFFRGLDYPTIKRKK
ncbi:MAG: helix-turn-helix domain-containing protein [Bacteroidota bacterium]